MRKYLTSLSTVFLLASCSSSAILEIPPVPELPANWGQPSSSTFPDSSCPKVSGEYSEPPVIYRSDGEVTPNSRDGIGSYYGHFPLHLADRKELAESEINLPGNRFLLKQPDADNFYLSFATQKSSIVEYHFQAEDGDFECRDRYIEFPIIGRSGMIEGKSVNSQIRNVVFRENAGALIVQKTIGPYRGNSSTTDRKFKHEFLRYQLYEGFPKLD